MTLVTDEVQTVSSILPEYEQFIQKSVETGVFRDRTEALNEALKLLKQRQELLAGIEEGIRQIENGECTEYDAESLDRRFEELKQIALGQCS
jgi:Arc/MetJ-type ribon-helix-helix transcriptional regulator